MRFSRYLLVTLALLAGSEVAWGEEPQAPAKKVVSLVWFPRFSHDGKRLATAHGNWDGNQGGDLVVWNVADGSIASQTPVDRGIRSVSWSAKDEFLLGSGYGGWLRIVDLKSGKQVYEMRMGNQTEGTLVFSDDSRFITTHGTGDVTLWDFAKRRPVNVWTELHKEEIWGQALSRDDKLLATAGKDGFVRVTDLTTFKTLHEWKHPRACNGLAFSPKGEYLCTGCEDSIIRVFSLTSGEELHKLRGHTRGTVTDMRFSDEGKLLISSGGDGTVRLWDWSNPEAPKLRDTIEAHNSLAFGVDLSPDGTRIASVGWDNKVKLWDAETLKEVWSKTRPQ